MRSSAVRQRVIYEAHSAVGQRVMYEVHSVVRQSDV